MSSRDVDARVPTVEERLEAWRAEAARFERDGALVLGGKLARRYVAEMLESLAAANDEALTLEEAERESGYHRDTIRHMLANGQLENVGRKGAPRVRRGALPRRAGAKSAGGYDAGADAAALFNRSRAS